MSDTFSSSRINEIPKWDGKSESMPMYLSKVGALLETQGVEHVLEKDEMTSLPTKEEYGRLAELMMPKRR